MKRVDQDKQGSGGGFNAVAEKRVDLAYDQLGRFTSVARYKDIDGGATNEVSTSSYLYDNGGRLTNLTHKKGATTQEGFTWSFDALDRVTQVVSTVDGTSAYKYDATDQLIAADHDATLNPQTADESYVNDLSGNRRASGTTNWKVDTDNRLSRDGVYEYTYDKEGNLTKRVALDVNGVANGATTEYAWDHRNRLTTVTEKPTPAGAATKIVAYEYDAFDRRIAKTVDTGTIGSVDRREFYIWSGDDVIFDFVDPDGAGAQPMALSKRYLRGEAVDQLLAQEDVTTGVLWPLGDNLGTTRDLVDNNGAVQTHYKYDTFGNLKTGDTTKTRFLYTAQEYDSDTGLIYYNARWYDPRQGRFISQDSWGFAAGDENLYRYVSNSPTNYIDPSGHAPIDSVPPGGVSVDPNAKRTPGQDTDIYVLPPESQFEAAPANGYAEQLVWAGIEVKQLQFAVWAAINRQKEELAFYLSEAGRRIRCQERIDAVVDQIRELRRLDRILENEYRKLKSEFNAIPPKDRLIVRMTVYGNESSTDFEEAQQILIFGQGPNAIQGATSPIEIGIDLVTGGIALKNLGEALARRWSARAAARAAARELEERAAKQLLKELADAAKNQTDDLVEQVAKNGDGVVECVPRGGSYKEVRSANTGGEVHHIPPSSVSPHSPGDSPAIWMETADHRKTASWGSSKAAAAYRRKQAELIKQGKLREAMQMDINDIRSKFGDKYDEGIKQMLDSVGFSE